MANNTIIQKSEFVADSTFSCLKAKIAYRGNRPWKNDLRLAGKVTAATRSYRQIEAKISVLWCIKKLNSAIAGEAILWPIYMSSEVIFWSNDSVLRATSQTRNFH